MSVTYFKWWGFSINEGGRKANIHISWHPKFCFYVCIGKWAWFKIVR